MALWLLGIERMLHGTVACQRKHFGVMNSADCQSPTSRPDSGLFRTYSGFFRSHTGTYSIQCSVQATYLLPFQEAEWVVEVQCKFETLRLWCGTETGQGVVGTAVVEGTD
ncbi:hypothetical protein CBL_10905 [Carabus blaptoides fortunei]